MEFTALKLELYKDIGLYLTALDVFCFNFDRLEENEELNKNLASEREKAGR